MDRLDRSLGAGAQAHVRCTGRAEGDLAVGGEPLQLAARRSAIVDRPWVWLEQVHGDGVVVVGGSDDPADLSGTAADASVTARTDVALAVHTADCAPLALLARGGIAAVHAGWRGLRGGVVEAAVAELDRIAPGEITAVLGPCIHPECYEFSEADLATVVEVLGDDVVGTTASGAPALDVPAAVDAALARAGVAPAERLGPCTACDASGHWSHRARQERERQALVVWRTVDADPGADRGR